MTKEAALQAFFSSFGLPAYEENAVPTGEDPPAFPYLTYSVATDSFGTDVPLSCSLWYRDTSWKAANAKTREISEDIGIGGKLLPCDGGSIWIRRGSPFAQSMGDESDELIKRKYINITAEFFTAD